MQYDSNSVDDATTIKHKNIDIKKHPILQCSFDTQQSVQFDSIKRNIIRIVCSKPLFGDD